MSTYLSDSSLRGMSDDHGAWIDVASDSMVEMKVRILVARDMQEEAEIHLSPDDADRVAEAIQRAAAMVRESI